MPLRVISWPSLVARSQRSENKEILPCVLPCSAPPAGSVPSPDFGNLSCARDRGRGTPDGDLAGARRNPPSDRQTPSARNAARQVGGGRTRPSRSGGNKVLRIDKAGGGNRALFTMSVG